jgi:hypothetical protein
MLLMRPESVFNSGALQTALIMDEVDGMSGGDRGGMQELYSFIRTTKVNYPPTTSVPCLRDMMTRSRLSVFVMTGQVLRLRPWLITALICGSEGKLIITYSQLSFSAAVKTNGKSSCRQTWFHC